MMPYPLFAGNLRYKLAREFDTGILEGIVSFHNLHS